MLKCREAATRTRTNSQLAPLHAPEPRADDGQQTHPRPVVPSDFVTTTAVAAVTVHSPKSRTARGSGECRQAPMVGVLTISGARIKTFADTGRHGRASLKCVAGGST